MCLFAGIQFALVGASRIHERVYLAFGCLCLLLAGYLLLTAVLYQTHSVAVAAQVVRAQMAFSCSIYPAAIGFIGLYAKLRHWRRWFAIACIGFGVLFTINLFSPNSMLYSAITYGGPLTLHWGESVSYFDSVESSIAPAYYLLEGACYVWALGCCIALWRRGQHARMWPLALYLAIQFFATEHAEVVNRSGQRSLTFDALAFLALALIMSDVLRRELRGQTKALAASLGKLRIETDRRQSVEDDLRHLAYHDPLTGLPNRHRMQDDLHAALAARPAEAGALVVLDLDNFKTINDALGHAVGDEVLRSFAERLRVAVPAGTRVAHFGGDDFALLLQPIGSSESLVASHVRALVLDIISHLVAPLHLGDHELVIGASAGIALFDHMSGDTASVLREVDVALHRAKTLGRNIAVVFESPMQSDIQQRHALESGLRLALKHGEFEVHYQPQVDMQGRFIGAEALVRWRHPVHGLIAPAEFIAIAEEAGLIHAIGREVLRQACMERSTWPASLARARVSVNISPWQLFAQDCVGTLLDTVRATDADPAHITLEITENIYLHDLDDIASKIRALDALGFHFSLDDFGSGHTSLASLKTLPVRELKIDRVFIDALKSDTRDGFVEAMIAIAHHLDLVVIAEGVETEAQLQALRAMGCDAVQGYLVSRPLDAAAFRSWLAANVV
ncbi:MAG: bifunctional diguanylate cyclase/phosphodiesterase [Dokdonella sp.]